MPVAFSTARLRSWAGAGACCHGSSCCSEWSWFVVVMACRFRRTLISWSVVMQTVPIRPAASPCPSVFIGCLLSRRRGRLPRAGLAAAGDGRAVGMELVPPGARLGNERVEVVVVLLAQLADVGPEVVDGGAAGEPEADIDLEDHEAGRQHDGVRHGRGVVVVDVLGDAK